MPENCDDQKHQIPLPRFWLRRDAAARHLGLAPATLAKYATRGGGPLFSKRGRLVLYSVADLDAWARATLVRSTSEAA